MFQSRGRDLLIGKLMPERSNYPPPIVFQSRGRDLLIGKLSACLDPDFEEWVSVPWSGFINRKERQ